MEGGRRYRREQSGRRWHGDMYNLWDFREGEERIGEGRELRELRHGLVEVTIWRDRDRVTAYIR